MASKCGRSVTAWNALIATLAKQGNNIKALSCLEDMQQLHVSPDASTLSCILKVCGNVRSIDRGREIHAETVRKGLLDMDTILCSALIHMYSECGSFAEAGEVFAKLQLRDTGLWNASIASHVKQGDDLGAMSCFEMMMLEGISPDAITFTSGLKACSRTGDGAKGRELHSQVTKRGLLATKDLVLASALVDLYANCGSIVESWEVFDAISSPRNVGLWNSLIAAYVQHGCHGEASKSLKQMQLEGIAPDSVTFACSLKACNNAGAMEEGRELHCVVERVSFLGKDSIICSVLVDMYARNGRLREAREMFDEHPAQSSSLWTALISGYVEHERDEEALVCFEQMRAHGVALDAVACICILRACGKARALEKGMEIRDEVDRNGLGDDPGIRNALVVMYVRCMCFAGARDSFDGLRSRDMLAWTSLLAGYAENGRGAEALACFEQMQAEGVLPDGVTFSCASKACGSLGSRRKGKEMHARIGTTSFLREAPVADAGAVGKALIAMYAKLGDTDRAIELLDCLQNPSTDAWNAAIAGCMKHAGGDGSEEEALSIFGWMQGRGASPDVVTYACLLAACARLGAASRGRSIHADLEKRGLLSGNDSVVGNALVDMYAKCGSLAEASRALAMLEDENRRRDAVVCWDALLTGFSQTGELRDVLQVFERMMNAGGLTGPSVVSFLALLNACSHAGAVCFAHECFDSMVGAFAVVPTAEHYTCMIDLLGRSGQLDRAWAAADWQLPFHPDAAAWSAVLSACRSRSDSELGSNAFLRILQLDDREGRGAYSCLRSIYAAGCCCCPEEEIVR